MRAFLLLLCLAFPSLIAMAQDPAPATQIDSIDEALDKAKTWKLGDDPAPMDFIRAEVLRVQGLPAEQNALAERLAELFTAEGTREFKEFIAWQLYLIGTEEQVEEVAPLLDDPDFSDLARQAIEAIPGKAVDDALIDALDSAPTEAKIGIVASMAGRGNAAFAESLARLLNDADAELAEAAAHAYAANEAAELAVIQEALYHAPEERRAPLYDALLTVAGRKTGEEGAWIFRDLLGMEETPDYVRAAALVGLAKAAPEEALVAALQAVASDSLPLQQAGLSVVQHANNVSAEQLFAVYSAAPAELKPGLLDALSRSQDPQAPLMLLGEINQEQAPALRAAILRALGHLGSAEAIPTLLHSAVNAEGEERDAAREALRSLQGDQMDETLASILLQSEEPQALELLAAIADRGTLKTTAPLFAVVQPHRGDRQIAAINAIGAVGTDADIEKLAELIPALEHEAAVTATEHAIGQILSRSGDSEAQVQSLLSLGNLSGDALTQASLLRAAGSTGNPILLDTLQAALKNTEPALQAAAVDVLAQWPDALPAFMLVDFASAASAPLRDDALNAYVRMLRMEKRPTANFIPLYESALALTENEDVVRAALAGLGEIDDPAALPIIERFLQTDGVKREAAVAAERVRSRSYRADASHNDRAARKALDGDGETRWDAGEFQQPGQWFQIDMGAAVAVRGVALDAAGSPDDYPRGYDVYVFDDPQNIGQPVASGVGEKPVFDIRFESKTGRYVRIVQTGSSDDKYWSIHEIRILPASN